MSREPLHNLLRSAACVPAVLAMLTYWRVRSACCAPATTEFVAMDGTPSLATVLQRFPGIVALCACMLLLGGCVHTTKAEFTRHYALTGPAPTANDSRHAANPGRKILQITRIAVPEWLVGTAMYYRLDYRHDSRLSAYGRSDWIAPPATLLESVVQNAITAGGGWRAVIGPGNPATADASLHLRLDDFSQTFSQPNHSAGILDATATLIDNHGDNVMAQKHFRIEVPATTPGAPGGVKALGEASEQFAARLQRWLAAMAAAV